MTGLEAEAALSLDRNFGKPDERIAIVQCVGSRDPSIGRNFCSGVCCAYAVRIARMVKFSNPEAQVTVYYIDLQNFDRQFTELLAETRDLSVEFIQGLPFMIDEESDGSLALTIEASNGDHEKAYYDRAILSVGIDSREGSQEVAKTVGLSFDKNGFLSSNQANVFTCGTCARPMSIPESIEAARETAHQMWIENTQ
jgi:heterodisulfide reductase subunit A